VGFFGPLVAHRGAHIRRLWVTFVTAPTDTVPHSPWPSLGPAGAVILAQMKPSFPVAANHRELGATYTQVPRNPRAFWQSWLRVAARFPRYSFRNTLLIQLQRPDASVVMGYRAWQALGHQVRKGEKSISILAPCTYKTKTSRNDNEDQDEQPAEKEASRRVLRGFRIAHVFDISSTDGDTVKPPAGPALLEGEAPAGLWDTLAAQVSAEGFTLTRAEIPSGANGSTNFATRTVTVADHLSPAQGCKTLAHELAHTCLHDGTEYAMGCRGQAEVEAESVAFILCQAAGLTTAAYSFGYVAGWSAGDPKKVKATAERVVTCARQILDRAGLLDQTADETQEAQAA
jgi:antirestriction protein ArdC